MVTDFQFRKIFGFILPVAIIFSLALAGGSIYAAISGGSAEELTAYFGNAFGKLSETGKASLTGITKKWVFMWLVIALSGGLLPGCVPNLATVSVRGFVVGYTAACFYLAYSYRGILLCLSLLPEMLLCIPVLIVFSSISLKMSFSKHESKKKLLKKYIVHCLIFFAIFCVVSLVQAYITTIFMKWAYIFVK